MAGLETIASIVGIAGVGIKLSKTLYQVGYKAANANHNINRIATNVSLFASMLKHVGRVLDDAHSLHSPEALETVKQIVKECESVFKEIADIILLARDKTEGPKDPPLANGGKRRISMVARAKWYFEGPKAEHLLAQLEYLKTTLSVLLQTLNLAAMTAKINETLGQSEKPPEIVSQERLHVETLIVAQQLSVHTLRETQEKLDAESTRPSSPSDDTSMEPRYPKLLTQGSQTSLQMVRLGNGELEFLDRRPSTNTEDGASLEHTTSRSETFIDDLLAKWTVSPEEKLNQIQEIPSPAEEPDREATPVPLTTRNRHEPTGALRNANATPVPNVTVQSSQPSEFLPLSSTPMPPSRQWMSPRSDAATLATRDPGSVRASSSLGYAPSDMSSYPSRTASPRVALERSLTNPETDNMPVLNSFHDHHGLQQPNTASRTGTPGIPPPPMPIAPRTPAPHRPHALAPYMAGAAAASGNVHLSPGWGNYKQPYVSDEDSTWSPTDSDDSPPTSRAGLTSPRPRRDSITSAVSWSSQQTPYDSGTGIDAGDGLGIPWRIRVSADKYFDFRDDMLIGPRTPYLPSEPRSWIHTQESACTEISKHWVREEALVEMRYPHTDLHDSHDILPIAGDEGGWTILQPLKFHEIDALVNRTVQLVETAQARKTSGPAQPPSRTHSGYAGPPVRMPEHPPLPNRSISYNDGLPPLHPPAGTQPRGPSANLTMSPRDVQDHTFSPRERHGRNEWREAHRERDRSKERWLAQKEHDRERERERQSARGKPKRKGNQRDKANAEKKKEKHKGSGMGSTLAKVGTLAVLLEGLDGAF